MERGLVVRNTFIEAAADEDDEDEPLNRSQTDPTGGRSKNVMPLMNVSDIKVPPSIQEADQETEAGDPLAPLSIPLSAPEVCRQNTRNDFDTPHDDLDDEVFGLAGLTSSLQEDVEDDESPRLVRSAPGRGGYNAQAEVGAGRASRTVARPVALTSLLPEAAEKKNPEPDANAPAYVGGVTGPGLGGMPAWPYMMPGMFDQFAMFPMGYPPSFMPPAAAGSADAGKDGESSNQWQPLPALGAGPPIGYTHSFHKETRNMGNASPDFRQFTKVGYEGRLSTVSESRVHDSGVHRYLVQFSVGELSPADGVGFIFSPRLPCAKNIQKIVSVYVNKRGRVCYRVFAEMEATSVSMQPFECGDWIEMAVDLDNQVITFNVWPPTPTGWPVPVGQPSSTAEFPYGAKLAKHQGTGAKAVCLTTGHLACVVKNPGVTITLGS